MKSPARASRELTPESSREIVLRIDARVMRRAVVAAALIVGIVVLLQSEASRASNVSLPNSFENGQIADANEVNQNFEALSTGVNDNDRRLVELENLLLSLQSSVRTLRTSTEELSTRVATIETSSTSLTTTVDELEASLRGDGESAGLAASVSGLQDAITDVELRLGSVEETTTSEAERDVLSAFRLVDDEGIRTVRLVGANLQIVNGEGETATANGSGNLILGYNEGRPGSPENRGGSHNVVVGRGHNYPSFGGLVAGRNNTIVGDFATVCGGSNNTARGADSSVGGGCGRQTPGDCDWIGGQLFQEE